MGGCGGTVWSVFIELGVTWKISEQEVNVWRMSSQPAFIGQRKVYT